MTNRDEAIGKLMNEIGYGSCIVIGISPDHSKFEITHKGFTEMTKVIGVLEQGKYLLIADTTLSHLNPNRKPNLTPVS